MKIYRAENGADQMRALYVGKAEIQISALARLEFVSATARKYREGEYDDHAFELMLKRFSHDLTSRFVMLAFSPFVLQEAARLLAEHRATPLRTLDALQFAFYVATSPRTTTFVSAAKHLLAILAGAGHSTFDAGL